MPDDAKTCFIIQPISTPKDCVAQYNGDIEHFIHVLQCLHIPAVKVAGFRPIEPIAEGSDLIQAEIITNLETADLVLCDISCLNPNVFFEMGVRTALNKPICFVMDEHTGKIPFDTGMLNHKAYKSTLHAWELESQIQIISDHLKASHNRSDNQNTLWRRLGIRSEARAYELKEGPEGKIDELLFQMQTLQEKVDLSTQQTFDQDSLEVASDLSKQLVRITQFLNSHYKRYGFEIGDVNWIGRQLILMSSGPQPSRRTMTEISRNIYKKFGLKLTIYPLPPIPDKIAHEQRER